MPELAPIPDRYKSVGVVALTSAVYTQAEADAAAAAGTLTPGTTFTIEGVVFRALTSSTYVAVDGNALADASETVLAIGASTIARTCCINGVDQQTIAINSAKGTITFRSSQAMSARVGDVLRIESNNNPSIECDLKVTYRATEGSGTRFIGTIQNGLVLPDCAAGDIKGSVLVYQRQHWSAAASWLSMLQISLSARIRCIPLGTSGTTVTDWLNPYRLAQIASYGRVGAIVLDVLGNTVKSGLQTAAQAMADLESLIQKVRPQAPIVYVLQPPSLTSENHAAPDNSQIGANSTAFTVSSRVISMLDDLPAKYPFVRIVPIFAAEAENFGNTAFYTGWANNIANGWTRREHKADDGVHNLWNGAQTWAVATALVMALDFPPRMAEAGIKPNNVLTSTQVDLAGVPGNGYVRNLFEGALFGTVATGTNGPGIPNCMSASATGATGYTISNGVVLNPDAGNDWISTVVSNGTLATASTAFSQIYTGTANSLMTLLNQAQNQGVDIDVIVHCGIFGFNDFTMQVVEVVIEGDTGDGQGVVPLASGFSSMGNFQAGSMQYSDSTKGAQGTGFFGAVRLPRFQIPPGTVFTSVQIRQSCKPRTGYDVGTLYMRMGCGSLVLVRK